MIHAIGKRLNVAVEHGAGAAPAHPVPGAMHIEIFLRRFLALRNGGPDFLAKDFCAAASQGVQAGVAQFGQRFPHRLPGKPRQVQHFNSREAFQLQSRIQGFQRL